MRAHALWLKSPTSPAKTVLLFGAGNVCVSGVVDALPKRYTIEIYEGHEDLASYKAVLEAIIFVEKPSCVEMDFYFLSFKKKFCRHYNIIQSKSNHLTPRCACTARGNYLSPGS